MELIDVEGVIENEIHQGCTQDQIAMTYAMGIVSTWPTNWVRVNAAIIARWPKGLLRVKTKAWRIVESKRVTNESDGEK